MANDSKRDLAKIKRMNHVEKMQRAVADHKAIVAAFNQTCKCDFCREPEE